VEIVLALAAERGVEAITTGLIAERMGLTQGAVFRHFPTKEAIWAAVLDWLKVRLGDLFQRREAQPLDELERIFLGYMAFIHAYPAMPRLVFSDTFHHTHPVLHEEVRTLVAACEGRLAGLVAEAAAVGKARPDCAAEAAKLLLAVIQGVAFQYAILGLVADPRALGPRLFALWRTCLQPDTPTDT
jgi:AcrR family transcriptional regulator